MTLGISHAISIPQFELLVESFHIKSGQKFGQILGVIINNKLLIAYGIDSG